jgi:hypothetical protein
MPHGPIPDKPVDTERQAAIFESALRMISTAGSVGDDPLSDAYVIAGGGYGGLQAIAAKALELGGVDRTALHRVPPEIQRRVSPTQ